MGEIYIWFCVSFVSAAIAFVLSIFLVEIVRSIIQTGRRVRLIIESGAVKNRSAKLYLSEFASEFCSSYTHISFNNGRNLYQKHPHFREDE